MFCKNCGAQIEEDTKFCTKCGTAIAEITSSEPTMAAQNNPAVKPSQPPQKGGFKWWYVLIIIGGAMTLMVALMVITAQNADDNNAEGTASIVSEISSVDAGEIFENDENTESDENDYFYENDSDSATIGESDDEIIGTWEGEILLTKEMGFPFDMTTPVSFSFTFDENGRMTGSADEEDLRDLGKAFVEQQAEKEGKDIDEYLAEKGMDLEELLDETMELVGENTEITTGYRVEDGLIYSQSRDEDEKGTPYSISGDTMYMYSYDGMLIAELQRVS